MASQLDLNLGVLGSSGLKQTGGYVLEEWHPKLRKPIGFQTIQQLIDNSSAVGAIRYLIRAYFGQVDFRIEPAEETPEAKDEAAFVESALDDMSHTFEEWLSECLTFLDFGWAYFEIVYKLRKGLRQDPRVRSEYEDGKWGWRKIKLRGQDTLDRWDFDEEGGLNGMHQTDNFAGRHAYIPIEKALLFRTEAIKDNPEGKSIFRNAVTDSFKLTRLEEMEVVGIERDMLGLLKMSVPMQLLQTNAGTRETALRATLEKMLSELKRDEREFAMVPTETDPKGNATGFKLELLQGASRKPNGINESKNYYRTAIMQSVLAQFIQLGMTNRGSFALASAMTSVFAVALGGYLDIITSVWNRFAIPRLETLNGIPRELWPHMVHGDLETPALNEIGAYITALASAGQLPADDKPLQRKLLEFASLPQPIEDEDEQLQKERLLQNMSKRASVRRSLRGPARIRQMNLPFGG